MKAAPTLCLCMIACNEACVIERALRSVRDILDYWVICDTGSTDATPVIALNTLSGIPGQLHRKPWVNFGANRTEVLQLARPHADYLLIMDADMIANIHDPGFKETLSADAYNIRYEGDVDYSQVMLVSSRHDWRYTGVTHEYLDAETARTWERLAGLSLTHFGDGGMRADKYERDARLLTEALKDNPDDPRTVFYLAQSHYYLGNFAEALAYYQRRVALEGWDEERWYAMYMTGRCRQALGAAWEIALEDYKRAYEARPWRIEPLYEIVRHYREAGDYATGYTCASNAGLAAPYPANDLLFIEKLQHEFYFPLELGVCAYGSGLVAEAIDAFNLVLCRVPREAWVRESAIRGRSMALRDLFPPVAEVRKPESNHLAVLVPFHNPGPALERCMQSLEAQDHPDFEVIFLDEASTDSASRMEINDPRMRVIRRGERHGLAANLHQAIPAYCSPKDVVVCVDGDDWLTAPDVLSYIDSLYGQHDCWVTFGQFEFANGDYGFAQPFSSEEDFATLRDYFRASHLRTFRAGLFHRIAEQDPEYACLKDASGNWLSSAVDVALMCPLLEMAGFARVRFADRVLYHYNDEGPNHLHAAHRQAQMDNFELIRNKPRFRAVDHYQSAALGMTR